jgi:tetratricopeptide (TPR) repeat protein
MELWIEHVQHFVTSGFQDQAAWEAAQDVCNNHQIRLFLKGWPVKSDDEARQVEFLAGSLESENFDVDALIVRFLTYLPTFMTLDSPLQISEAQWRAWFNFAYAITEQLDKYDELMPSSGLMHFTLGSGLCELSNYRTARTALEAASSIYQRLAKNHPVTYLPKLVEVMKKLIEPLLEIGDLSAACVNYEEILKVVRDIALEQPTINRLDEASILNDLGALRTKLNDLSSARKILEEALEICRKIDESNQTFGEKQKIYNISVVQPVNFLSCMAKVLNNLGNVLRDMGILSEARQDYEEALAIYRQLQSMSSTSYLLDIAHTLNNLGNVLHDTRDFQTARRMYEDAVEIYRNLGEKQFEADSLNNLGNLFRSVRNFQNAIYAFEKALGIYCVLLQVRSIVHFPRIAVVLNNYGCTLRDTGCFQEAHEVFEQALDIYRFLAKEEPAAYLPKEANTLNNFGSSLLAAREFRLAESVLNDALGLFRQLASDEPAIFRASVAAVLNNLSGALTQIREFSAARRACEESLVIRRQLAVAQPEVYLPDLVTTLNNYGVLLLEEGDFSSARTNFTEAVKLVETSKLASNLLHFDKYFATESYTYLLTDAVACGDDEKAFALSMAMRDGRIRHREVGTSELISTQTWLKKQAEIYGAQYRLLVANGCATKEQLVLGLITHETSCFVSLKDNAWGKMFPCTSPYENQQLRYKTARDIWLSLPATFQEALSPTQISKPFIVISGDVLWSAFPWELLRFGDGPEDYLGLHYALPRIGAIQVKDLQSQLTPRELGQSGGRMTILAPYDTGVKPLKGVPDEVKSVRQVVEARGGAIVAPVALGRDASDLEFERQIDLQPDILYYSGHGEIVREEELLVLHRDKSEQNALTPTTHFGKGQLMWLAEHRGAPLFPQYPLIVLNSCLTGRTRQAGGAREDLISAFLSQGAGAVIATAMLMYDDIGKAFGEALFDPTIAHTNDIASIVVGVRRRLARELCADVDSELWGEWGLIHLHGNARAALPFKQVPVT